jgi:hypothetical protein
MTQFKQNRLPFYGKLIILAVISEITAGVLLWLLPQDNLCNPGTNILIYAMLLAGVVGTGLTIAALISILRKKSYKLAALVSVGVLMSLYFLVTIAFISVFSGLCSWNN